MTTIFSRSLQIFFAVLKFRLFTWIPSPTLRVLLGIIALFHPLSFKYKKTPLETRTRLAFESLGPVFIKFGQMLSTRHDILTEEAATELAKLQDQVPGFDTQLAREIIETELKQPINQLFERFDDTPLASASVAQVHTASLINSLINNHHKNPIAQEVVIKVIRPGIEKIIHQDLKWMKLAAAFALRWIPDAHRFHPTQLVRDYEDILLGELDLNLEATNAQQFSDNFKNSDLLYVPQIHWSFVTSKVMVSERIYGVAVNDMQAFEKAGVNLSLLAERGAEIFFTQVFRDNFFHADMHPGNIFVDISRPELPRYIALDCAIVGTLSQHDQWLLGKQLLAVMDQDYERLARLMVTAGWVPSSTSIYRFSQALAKVCRPIFSKPLSEIEFGQLLIKLFATARSFDMQSLPQLMLLEKTLLHVEGLGRQLYPNLDIWQIGRPLLEGWLRQEFSSEKILKRLQKDTSTWLEILPKVPQLLATHLERANQVERANQAGAPHHTDFNQDKLTSSHRQLERRIQRLLIGTLCVVFAGITLYDPQLGFQEIMIPSMGWLPGIFGIFLLTTPPKTAHR